MANMPATAAGFKRKYCEGDSAECARFMIFKALGKGMVPPDLFPNQVDRARQVITAG
jgi:hypothetical protein